MVYIAFQSKTKTSLKVLQTFLTFSIPFTWRVRFQKDHTKNPRSLFLTRRSWMYAMVSSLNYLTLSICHLTDVIYQNHSHEFKSRIISGFYSLHVRDSRNDRFNHYKLSIRKVYQSASSLKILICTPGKSWQKEKQ